MTHQYSKLTRKKLQELAGLAHKRELSRAMEDDLVALLRFTVRISASRFFNS